MVVWIFHRHIVTVVIIIIIIISSSLLAHLQIASPSVGVFTWISLLTYQLICFPVQAEIRPTVSEQTHTLNVVFGMFISFLRSFFRSHDISYSSWCTNQKSKTSLNLWFVNSNLYSIVGLALSGTGLVGIIVSIMSLYFVYFHSGTPT